MKRTSYHVCRYVACGFFFVPKRLAEFESITSVTTPQAIRHAEEAQIALNGIYRIAAYIVIMVIMASCRLPW